MADLNDLQVTSSGCYFVKVQAVSSPASYDATVMAGPVEVRPASWVAPGPRATKKNVKIKFNKDYDSVPAGRMEQLKCAIKNEVYGRVGNATIGGITLSQGITGSSLQK